MEHPAPLGTFETVVRLRYPLAVLGLLAVGCTSSGTDSPAASSATRPPASSVEPPSFEQMQDALEAAVTGGWIEECPFEVASGEFTDVLDEVFEIPDRPWASFASGRLDRPDDSITCVVDWGRDAPKVSITARRKLGPGVAGEISGPRAESAEDTDFVACRTKLVLGDFDVIVGVDRQLGDCATAEPIAERLVLAAAASLVTKPD